MTVFVAGAGCAASGSIGTGSAGRTTSLSVIVPTPDGEGLARLFESLHPQLVLGDEVLIVGDTHSRPLPEVREAVLEAGFRWLEYDAGHHAWGHPQVNHGIENAAGDYLVFIDDEDVFAPDALANIREVASSLSEPRPLMFRFYLERRGCVLWAEQRLVCGSIGGHEFVTPNDPERLGRWADRYEGDFDFIESTLALWSSGSLVWREEIISYAR